MANNKTLHHSDDHLAIDRRQAVGRLVGLHLNRTLPLMEQFVAVPTGSIISESNRLTEGSFVLLREYTLLHNNLTLHQTFVCLAHKTFPVLWKCWCRLLAEMTHDWEFLSLTGLFLTQNPIRFNTARGIHQTESGLWQSLLAALGYCATHALLRL